MGNLARFALAICAAALFASCSGSPAPPIGAPNAITQTSVSASSRTDPHRTTTSPYEVVYKFSRSQDGGRPDGSLLAVNGMLYGTTVPPEVEARAAFTAAPVAELSIHEIPNPVGRKRAGRVSAAAAPTGRTQMGT